MPCNVGMLEMSWMSNCQVSTGVLIRCWFVLLPRWSLMIRKTRIATWRKRCSMATTVVLPPGSCRLAEFPSVFRRGFHLSSFLDRCECNIHACCNAASQTDYETTLQQCLPWKMGMTVPDLQWFAQPKQLHAENGTLQMTWEAAATTI